MFIGSVLLPQNKERNKLYTCKLPAYYTKSVQLILTTCSSPSWEANKSSASQDIPRILWNPKVHYRIHNSQPTALPSARSIQSKPPHPTSWRSILILSSHLQLGLASGLFPSRLPTKTRYASLLSHICATFPANHILLHLITQMIFGEVGSSWSSSLCSLLHSLLPRPS